MSSSIHFTPVILMIMTLLTPISTTAHTHPCTRDFAKYVSNKKNITSASCLKLHTLGAQFGWKHQLGPRNESHLDICIGAEVQSETGWLAWGVNPQTQSQMVGTRALIGIRQPNGSLAVNTYNITWETKLGCQLLPSDIDLNITSKMFEYSSANEFYIMCATLQFEGSMYNPRKLNHVWQVGKASDGLEPLRHPNSLENVDSTETMNLASGDSQSYGAHRHRLRTVHGVLNMIGWGTFLPVGVIVARYFKFPLEIQRWKRVHVSCQIIGYLLGTTGWIIGLYLGNASKYFRFPIHGLMSNILFAFATLQMLAIRLKPSRKDEYMKYWVMYHHFLGYALLSLIIVNIFRGIGIFTPNHTWKKAYIGLLGALASITLALEIYTWVKFKINEKRSKTDGNGKGDKKDGNGKGTGNKIGASGQDRELCTTQTFEEPIL